jgi:hypothetical protein
VGEPLYFGACRVVAELGSGALSTVYKATQEPLGRTVAVKALKGTIATTSPFAAHLEREARLLGELSHPNVALLYEFVKSERQMYLVLEHVDGYSLAALLTKKPKLRPEAVAAIGAEIARGLEHAHDRGIIHRDVKPGNVLLSKRGDVKLVDFGIAQRDKMPSLEEPLARTGDAEAFGTPAYMSPEQILGEFVDARSDLFSLGVVLYQMLSGTRPFDAEETVERRGPGQRIRRDPPKPLRARAPEVPRTLEQIVTRCLEKLPADRYGSAATVADALSDFVRATVTGSRRAVIGRALREAGLSKVPTPPGSSAEAILEAVRLPLRPVVIGFGVLSALVVTGGAALQWSAQGEREASRAGGEALELVPKDVAALRVVATPWAEVWVDGQHVETTPFAHAIPLAAGTHYVALTHPDAQPEKRVVKLAPGETIVLDVTMDVRGNVRGGAPPAVLSDSPSLSSTAADARRDSMPRGR